MKIDADNAKLRTLALFLCLPLFLCSCRTVRPELPADVPINRGAGQGGWLIVNLRTDAGKEFPFVLDTGAPLTALDRTLEPTLGERLGTGTVSLLGAKQQAGVYVAPKLYLGHTLLAAETNIGTCDLSRLSSLVGGPIMGILGMDCLCHYCIQLDFQAGKMRFLPPDHASKALWGQAFPLIFSSKGQSETYLVRPIFRTQGLFAKRDTDFIVDTGGAGDGTLEPTLFRQEVLEGRLRIENGGAGTQTPEYGSIQERKWNGKSYRDVRIGKGENTIGLRFLARHLVTFDLPGRTMYLKQKTAEPLVDKTLLAAAKASGKSALKELKRLARLHQLPGNTGNERFENKEILCTFRSPDSVVLSLRKKSDSTVYRYEFTQRSGSWKLERAWRTDQNDRVIEEYDAHEKAGRRLRPQCGTG